MGGSEKKPGFKHQFHKVFKFLSRAKSCKIYLSTLLLLALVLSVLELSGPEILRRGIGAIQNGQPDILKAVGWLAGIFTVAFLVLSAVNKLYSKYVNNKVLESVQFDFMDRLVSLKKLEFGKYSSGEIITYVINNAESGANNGITGLISMFQGIVTLLASVVYMMLVDWRLTLAVILFNIGLRSIITYFGKRIQSASEKLVGVIKTNNSFIVDLLNNMITVRTFHRIDYFRDALHIKEKQTLKASVLDYSWGMSFFDLIWMGMKTCEYVVMYGFGGYLVYRNLSSIATVTAFVSAAVLLVNGINYFTGGYASFKRAVPAVENVNEILDNQNMEKEISKEIQESDFVVRFENMGFSFGDKQILQDVNFTIREKEKIMIKGTNGSGKSTLLNLISGLYRPTQGSIFYGDCNIVLIHLDSLIKKYLYITQNSNILEGGVYENLSLSLNFKRELCNEILQKLNLAHIQNAVPKLLSQGERQRLNIGRALYRQKDICLILGDEIFSNIDADNTQMIAELLSSEFRDKTVILVCHEAVDFQFDKVFTVEQGRVKAGAAV